MPKFLIIVALLMAVSLTAQVRRDFNRLKEHYEIGNLSEMQEIIKGLKPNRDEERAMIQYYTALLEQSSAEALVQFRDAADRYPQTHYGQLSMLEAAKIHILEREIPSAQALLRRINSAEIIERFYWLAVTHFWLDDYSSAIANSENYLRLKSSGNLAETALHLIADSYIAQAKYQSALSSLQKVDKLKEHDAQYLSYRTGYAYEHLGYNDAALKAYQKGYEMDKYSQVAFDIEERLFFLRSRIPSLDLSFLYPYKELKLDPQKTTQITMDTSSSVSDTSSVAKLPSLLPLDPDIPIKLLIKPNSGNYLQAGRFSVEANADGLVRNIRQMQIPASYFEDDNQGNTTWVVLAGPFVDSQQMSMARRLLTDKDINSFIVQN